MYNFKTPTAKTIPALNKIFNRKALKISYSFTKNIFEIINNPNKEIIRKFHDRTNNNSNNDNNNNNNNTSRQNECNCKTRKKTVL